MIKKPANSFVNIRKEKKKDKASPHYYISW